MATGVDVLEVVTVGVATVVAVSANAGRLGSGVEIGIIAACGAAYGKLIILDGFLMIALEVHAVVIPEGCRVCCLSPMLSTDVALD